MPLTRKLIVGACFELAGKEDIRDLPYLRSDEVAFSTMHS